MSRRLNLVGQKFGKLTCLEYVGSNRHNKSVFRFKCDCGKIIETMGSSVVKGNTNSCGCYRKECVSEIHRLDLVGQKFSKLTCMEFVGVDKKHQSIFKFQCDCGNLVEKVGYGVKIGDIKSCGCLKKDQGIIKRLDLTGQKFGRLTCLEFVKIGKDQRSIFKFQCDCGKIIEALGKSVKIGHTKSCGCLKLESVSINGSNIGINNSKSANKGWCYGITRMRSGIEIFYAYYLDQCNIDWEYEPETFKLDNGIRYTPDFYLPETDTWVEIKGRMTDENRKKISLFRTQTGNKLKVYFLRDLEKLAGESYQSFMKENKAYYL